MYSRTSSTVCSPHMSQKEPIVPVPKKTKTLRWNDYRPVALTSWGASNCWSKRTSPLRCLTPWNHYSSPTAGMGNFHDKEGHNSSSSPSEYHALCTSTRRKLREATHFWICWIWFPVFWCILGRATTYKIFQIHNLCMVCWLNQHTFISCFPCSNSHMIG